MQCRRTIVAILMAIAPAPAATATAGEPVRAFGLPHEATGDAVVTIAPSGVVITGIGASGLDGARVTLGDAAGWLGAVDFGPAGALAPGSHVRIAATFATGGAPGSAALTIEETAGGLAAVRLEEVGCACVVTVELRLDGSVVDAVVLGPPPYGVVATGALGTLGALGENDAAVPTIRAERTATITNVADRAFVLRNPAPTPITLAGGAPTPADEIRVRLDGVADGVTTSHVVTLTAANIETVTLREESLVQFGVDHRAELESALELSGAIDEDGEPDVVGANAGIDPLFFAPGPDTAAPVGAVDLRLTFLTEWPDFAWFARETQAVFESGSVGPLTSSAIDGSGACGCAYLGRVRPVGENVGRTLVARLDGAVVASAELVSDPVFVADLASRPQTWTVELLPDAPAGLIRYREIWRWDEPTSLLLYNDLDEAVVDEVEVTVEETVGALGAPVALAETFLGPWGFAKPTSFVIDAVTHRPLAASCPGDVTGDGVVSFADLLRVLGAWGNAGGPEDVDGNGAVDFGDVLAVLAAWGPCAPSRSP